MCVLPVAERPLMKNTTLDVRWDLAADSTEHVVRNAGLVRLEVSTKKIVVLLPVGEEAFPP